MATWIEPVFDRTQADVEFAIQKISEWIAADINGSVSVYDLKGCLSVHDINRIEGNIAFLAEQLKKYYYSPSVSTKTWARSGMPTENDIKRIVGNIKELFNSFYIPQDDATLPDNLIHYESVNTVEKKLYLIKEMLDWMVNSFKQSGTFYSGSTTFLPMRR